MKVIAREIAVKDVEAVTGKERPDVALVGLGKETDHALALIDQIVREAACPVILLIHAPDPSFVKEASKRGIFAYISDSDVDEWQGAMTLFSTQVRQVPRPRRRVRPPSGHRAGEGHPDGASFGRRG